MVLVIFALSWVSSSQVSIVPSVHKFCNSTTPIGFHVKTIFSFYSCFSMNLFTGLIVLCMLHFLNLSDEQFCWQPGSRMLRYLLLDTFYVCCFWVYHCYFIPLHNLSYHLYSTRILATLTLMCFVFQWQCATWLTLIVPTSMTAYLYLYSHGEVSLAASQPV